MVYSLTYRRPAYVSSPRGSVNGDLKPSSLNESVSSGSTYCAFGIPDALSFDRIISGGTCPPCTTRDFMNYLIYIEHAAENLQFFLWFRNYSKRFSELPQAQRTLAPEWTVEQAEAETQGLVKKNANPETAAVFKGTEFASTKVTINEFGGNPFNTPPRTPSGDTGKEEPARPQSEYGWSDDGSTLKSSKKSFMNTTAGAFEGADLKWQPFTIQPFREEISRIIAGYVADGAPRQLNLSSKERSALLHALANTTHPSAFRQVVHTVEWSLRHQAHPNFVRWAICNGNRPRVLFAHALGTVCTLAGLITAILITLSSAGRGWRVVSAIGFLIGIATLIAAWKGMCIVLHGLHHRHLRPWELFAEEDDNSSIYEMKKDSFESAGSNNSYEDEPWVVKYEKRHFVRKIFDREVWVQDPTLRKIQDTIFIQSIAGSFVLTTISVGIFCAFPKGNLY